jgi:3-phenylpropionate/trans-cinnamate dioxygenase ferredoxin reductase component
MTVDSDLLIIGGGQAAGELAAALRSRDWGGSIAIVGEENHVPYTRPPLSKAYLRGEIEAADLYLRQPDFYDRHGIAVSAGVAVADVDLEAQMVTLDDGRVRTWRKLVFATGGRPRRLPDSILRSAPNVHYIRTLADADRLKAVRKKGASFVVVGGGYVGLEIASVLRSLDARVTLVEAADRLLGRVTSPVVSEFFRRLHLDRGVDVRVGTAVVDYQYSDSGNVVGAVLSDGSRVAVDELLVGIGMVPNDELAARAGIAVDDGILVDRFCRTSANDVFAVGDVAIVTDLDGRARRLESMPNAVSQARVLADYLSGVEQPAVDPPWFWSDQYEIKLQAAGLVVPYDELVIRGASEERKFSVLYLRDGVVTAVDAIGSPADFAAARKLIAQRVPVDLGIAADPGRRLLEAALASAGARA